MRHIWTATIFSICFCLASTAQADFAKDGFGKIAEKAFPSVVNIAVMVLINDDEAIQERLATLLKRSPKKDLFGADLLNPPRKAQAQGSGFIIDPEGYIVTNYHVVENAAVIKVILSDETVLDAKLIGKDRKTDLALLKVSTKKKLNALKWGDSQKCKIGNWAVLLGNPFGIGLSLSSGTISNELRDASDIADKLQYIENLIQTDAPLNPGNSGGPMLNTNGEVIGVNAMIASPSGGGHGVGFAIPSKVAKKVIKKLKKYGKVPRSWLGLISQPVTKEIAANLGLKEGKGLLIADTAKNGPAFKAAVKAGDVLMKLNSKTIESVKGLLALIEEAEINQAVDLEIIRNKQTIHLKATIEEQRDFEETKGLEIMESFNTKDKVYNKSYGFGYMTLIDQLRHGFNVVDPDVQGVLLYEVKEGGIASQSTFTVGDVILQINGQPVPTIEAMTKALDHATKESPDKPILAYVYRENIRFFMPLPAPSKVDGLLK
jgi:serine protease Do